MGPMSVVYANLCGVWAVQATAELTSKAAGMSEELEALRAENARLRADSRADSREVAVRVPPATVSSLDDSFMADIAMAVFGDVPALPSPMLGQESIEDEPGEYEVSGIVDHRGVGVGEAGVSGEYLVKWKIDGSETWEP